MILMMHGGLERTIYMWRGPCCHSVHRLQLNKGAAPHDDVTLQRKRRRTLGRERGQSRAEQKTAAFFLPPLASQSVSHISLLYSTLPYSTRRQLRQHPKSISPCRALHSSIETLIESPPSNPPTWLWVSPPSSPIQHPAIHTRILTSTVLPRKQERRQPQQRRGLARPRPLPPNTP